MTRDEHLEWAKERAREYLDQGGAINAVTSIVSDLGKHEAWQGGEPLTAALMMLFIAEPSVGNARRIIEGFR